MTSDKPHCTNFHYATRTTPYEIVIGQPPPFHLPYLPNESKVHVVGKFVEYMEKMIMILKFYFLRAQHQMKQEADKHMSERSFEIGDWIFVKLQQYRQKSLVTHCSQKISPKFYGPHKFKMETTSTTHLKD